MHFNRSTQTSLCVALVNRGDDPRDTFHSKYSSGYGHHARSRGTLREYGFRCVRLEPREALTDARERSAGLSLCSRGWGAVVRVCALESGEQ